METPESYINSGIIERYLLGETNLEESLEVERMSALHPEVAHDLNETAKALELYAKAHAKPVHPAVKPFLMAMIDYSERIKNGETPVVPPLLNTGSKAGDYQEWLSREDMKLPADFNQFHAKVIGHNPVATTAIVWIKTMAPNEVHTDEHEKFLILEGSCKITVGGKVHHLVPGNYFEIPLHEGHYLEVTSDIPCKVVLQRVAA